MNFDEQINISKAKSYKVVKHNELIQNTRYSLSTFEQKILLYLVSKVKPEDKELQWYEFNIGDFCKACDIDYQNGKNYKNVKSSILKLVQSAFWIERENGELTTCNWINKATLKTRSGKIRIRLDDDLQEYLVNLQGSFTAYELLNVLPMKSQYSIRLYELLHSYKFKKRISIEVDKLKEKLMITAYERYPDLRRYVLNIAIEEINKYTDLTVSYEPIKKGRKIHILEFRIGVKSSYELFLSEHRAVDELLGSPEQLDGQLNIYDYIREEE